MRKSVRKIILYYPLFLVFTLITLTCFSSCINKQKDFTDAIFGNFNNQIESSIDFSVVDCINESNKKTIEIVALAYNKTKDIKKKELFLKIKHDHQLIDSRLKQLTKDNLIIITKTIYNLDKNQDSLKGKKGDVVILKWLNTEIDFQISQLSNIEAISKNDDFKKFATQTKDILKENQDALKAYSSI